MCTYPLWSRTNCKVSTMWMCFRVSQHWFHTDTFIVHPAFFRRMSASCTHVPALLHALVALCPSTYSTGSAPDGSDDEALPVTSYTCQWKVPSKRKDCTLPLSEIVFEKHSYGRQRKRSLKITEEFDPRPAEYHNTAKHLLQDFLGKVKEKGL